MTPQTAMTVELAYWLLFEAVIVATSFALRWLAFWGRDRRQQAQQARQRQSSHAPISGLANPLQDDRATALPSAAD